MNYKIQQYSVGDLWSVLVTDRNVSSIMSKMVERAARLCECYASDIYYYLDAYYRAVQNNEDYDTVLLFREYGVNGKPVSNDTGNIELNCRNVSQCWRLNWDPCTQLGYFMRVRLNKIEEE